MTIDDAFDERLREAFAAAEPPSDPAFAERIARRIAAPDRRRALVVGGAGACGSAVASTQLQSLFEEIRSSAERAQGLGDVARLLAYVPPETLAAVALALMVTALAVFLPSRS